MVYHALLIMLLWSYWRAVLTSPKPVSRKWNLDVTEWNVLAHEPSPPQSVRQRNLQVTMCSEDGSLRWCPTCRIVKPDRCRHCSACGVCIKKFDHHCPWVANCVGWHNYKFFCLFLFYALLFLLYLMATSARYAYLYLHNDVSTIQAPVIFGLSLVFSFSVGSLFILHLMMSLSNQVTVEMGHPIALSPTSPLDDSEPPAPAVPGSGSQPQSQAPRGPRVVRVRRPFDLGTRRANFTAVFGRDKALWLLPVPSSEGDGETFRVKDRASSSANGHYTVNRASHSHSTSTHTGALNGSFNGNAGSSSESEAEEEKKIFGGGLPLYDSRGVMLSNREEYEHHNGDENPLTAVVVARGGEEEERARLL